MEKGERAISANNTPPPKAWLLSEKHFPSPLHAKHCPALNGFWIPHSEVLWGGQCFG